MTTVKRVIIALACALLAGCVARPQPPASRPVPDHGTRSVGAFTVVLESTTRRDGTLEVVLVTTNSTDQTQSANVENSAPVLRDRHGDVVRWKSAETECRNVTDGFLPRDMRPGACMTVTTTFKDPGPGARLTYSPSQAPPATWNLD